MKKTILSAFILIFAEALIIAIMLLIPYPIPTRVRILDICVLSVILWMIGYDLFRPLVNLAVKNPPEIGSLGIRWYGQYLYLLVAIGFGIAGIAADIPFVYQLLGQIVILGMLLLTYYFAMHAASKVTQVAEEEDRLLAGRQLMRTAIQQVQDEIAVSTDLPEYFRAQISQINESMRFISPCGSAEAVSYEKQFAEIAQRIVIAMSNFNMNEEAIKKDLLRMQRVLENRKNTVN